MLSFLRHIANRWAIIKASYLRFTVRFTAGLRLGYDILNIITFIGALACLTSILIYYGFSNSPVDIRWLRHIIRGAQILFIVNILYGLILLFRQTVRETKIIKWVVDIAVLITLLPLAYPRPDHPWIAWLDTVLYSRSFLFPVLAAYSIVVISFGILKLLGKRTNPSLILSGSFMLLIFTATLVLMMPRCTYHGISFIDSLFVSTSAVCITGLTTVDLPQTFTPTGLLVLALLIQTGGLGVMTFTSFFALFFSGNTSVYSQLMVKDMIYSKTLSSLVPTLLYILGFTLSIELIGAVAIYLSIHNTLGMSLYDEIIFSGFHSLSAFCNAGFSNIEGGLSNPRLLHSGQSVYIIVTLLVAAGGIGFPVLVNFRQAIGKKISVMWKRLTRKEEVRTPAHTYDLNTKIAVTATFWIMVVSTLLFLLFEYNNSLAGMSLYDKIVQSWFNSFVPRSSGFASVNPASFLNVTIIMFIFLMWIGGASQSTAGGIKVNTFATMLLNLRTIVYGRIKVTAFGRTISIPSLRRAHAVVAISILALFLYALILVWLEPGLPLKALTYEAASALFTVGSSLGITPLLSTASKALLCTAMFLGRVGLISLLSGVVGEHSEMPYRLPDDNVIIN